MTERTMLKQAFLAAMMKHKDARLFRDRAFAEPNLHEINRQIEAAGETITKADFFSRDIFNSYFLDTVAAWKNFDTIVDFVHSKGETFTADDFLQKLDDGSGKTNRTFLSSALENGAFDKVFQARIWQGRYDEVEHLYYSILPGQRRVHDQGHKLLEIKREIYADEGRELREDVLKDAGIDWFDLPKMFEGRNGMARLETYDKLLKEKGSKLTKEDVLMCNYEGDTMFSSKRAWDAFDKIAALLEANGETFGIEDFLTKRGHKPSVLTRAAQHDAVDKIFKPSMWVGRVADMVKLWNTLRPLEQTNSMGHDPFLLALSEAESQTYGPLFDSVQNKTPTDYISPIAVEGDVKILPLGLPSVWKDLDVKRDLFASEEGANAKSITMDDLRQTTGFQDKTILEIAIKAGFLNKVIEIATKTGEGLALQDLIAKDANENAMLRVIAERGELDTLFTPEIWAGRLQDMKRLWAWVPFEHKGQVNWNEVVNKTRVSTLKNQSGRKSPKLG